MMLARSSWSSALAKGHVAAQHTVVLVGPEIGICDSTSDARLFFTTPYPRVEQRPQSASCLTLTNPNLFKKLALECKLQQGSTRFYKKFARPLSRQVNNSHHARIRQSIEEEENQKRQVSCWVGLVDCVCGSNLPVICLSAGMTHSKNKFWIPWSLGN